MSLMKILCFVASILVSVSAQNSTRDSCMKVDNKISICRAFPSMPIEEYQNYCPDNYKVCNLRNIADISYLSAIYQQLPCTVTNIVESRGMCDSCNPDNLRTSLIHIGNCNTDTDSNTNNVGRILQMSSSDILIPLPRSQILNFSSENSDSIRSDFMQINYEQTIFMVNRTILLNMMPQDIYLIPQPYIDSTGKAYKVFVQIIFDTIPSFSMLPSLRPSLKPSLSLEPSNKPIEQSSMPSFTSGPTNRPIEESSMPSFTSGPTNRPSLYPNMSDGMFPTRIPDSSIHPTSKPTPLPRISFETSVSLTPRPSLMHTSDIISSGNYEQGTCWYNGIVLGDGQIIRNEIGMCTCTRGNVVCQTQKCIQSRNTFIDTTIINKDRCISSKRTIAVACCKIPDIICPMDRYFNKETFTCEPLRVCVNGVRTSDNQCECGLGYFGKNCEKNCRVDVCFNHGTCSFTDETVKCNCDSGWTGDFCRMPSLPDFNIRCQNGYPDIVNKKCKCFSGFFGDTCQNEVPCIFGRVNSDNKCICSSGYSGSQCDIRMFRRDIMSTNISTITSSPRTTLNKCFRGEYDGTLRKCICEHGWSGNTCEESICFTGHFDINTEMCKCRQGWIGRTCNVNCRQECNWHGSICVANNTGTCVCDNKWVGNTCEKPDMSKLDIKNLDKLEIKISESEGLNISTRISNFNFTIKSEVCILDNCLPISFDFRNMTRTSGRILQSNSPITINYQVEPNMTLLMVNSENSCSVSQSYSSGILNAQPSCDGTYNLLMVSSISSNTAASVGQPSNNPTPPSNDMSNTGNSSSNAKYWGFMGLGVALVGTIVFAIYLKKRNKKPQAISSHQVTKIVQLLSNPVNNQANQNIQQQSDRNMITYNPINVR